MPFHSSIKGFVQMKRDAIFCEKWEKLRFAEKGLLQDLILRAGWREGIDRGRVTLSMRALSKQTGSDREALSSLLHKLQDKGILSITTSREGILLQIHEEILQNLLEVVDGKTDHTVKQSMSEKPTTLDGKTDNGGGQNQPQNSLYHINNIIREEENTSSSIMPLEAYSSSEDKRQQSVNQQKELSRTTETLQETNQETTSIQNSPFIAEKREQATAKTKIETDFEEWWQNYLSLSKGIEGKSGKAIAKVEARKAWKTLYRSRKLLSLQDMIAGVERYATLNHWESIPQQYIPYASTFLNGERWRDTIPRVPQSPASTKAQQSTASPYDSWEEIIRQINLFGVGEPQKVSLHKETLQLIKQIGGWTYLCSLSDRERSFKRRDYENLAKEMQSNA